jgi:hypothetical protein
LNPSQVIKNNSQGKEILIVEWRGASQESDPQRLRTWRNILGDDAENIKIDRMKNILEFKQWE